MRPPVMSLQMGEQGLVQEVDGRYMVENDLEALLRQPMPAAAAIAPTGPFSETGTAASTQEEEGGNSRFERRAWTHEEDQGILHLVAQHGVRSWTLIAQELSKLVNGARRTGKQCRTRWLNHLDPGINKTPWTPEEERAIHEAQQRLGNRWAEIAKVRERKGDRR